MIHTRQNRTASRAILFLAFLLIVPGLLKAQSNSGANPCTAKFLKETASVDGYKFRSYWHNWPSNIGPGCLQIFHNGRIILQKTNEAGWYWLGQHPNNPGKDWHWAVPNIPNGTDITGLGFPDMIIVEYTGHANCCTLDYLFQLRPSFHLVAKLDVGHTETAYFADPDHNHHYYFYAKDTSFVPWPDSVAGTPVAPIVLKFVRHGESGSYHLALNKMRKPPPTRREWRKDLKDVRKWGGPFFDSGIWYYVMQLIYSGHSDLAWKFFDQAWPAKVSGKAKWLGDFCWELKSSPYWPDLKVEVRHQPKACADAKP